MGIAKVRNTAQATRMREIKFRAWDIVNAKMVEEISNHEVFIDKDGILVRYNTMEVMQFTGLHDKNGKEIYEGDIIYHSYFRERGAMEWYEKRTGFFLRWVEPFGVDNKVGGHQDMWPIDQGSFEVIGNIYESPNLLTSRP
jgi:uncharacterized phage protein (TIGR01671 family)